MVNVVSRSGRYGGPADTALRQATIASRQLPITFAAGFFNEDCPDLEQSSSLRFACYPIRSLIRSQPFPTAFSFRGVRTLWRSVSASDVIHLSIARELMPILTLLFAVVRRRATVVQPHGMLTSGAGVRQSVVDLVVKPLVRRADVVVALTAFEEQQLRAWLGGSGEHFVRLHNPVVSSLRSGTNEPVDPAEVLFLGRLHARKRLDVFIDAAALAADAGLHQSWVVVGPDEGELERVEQAVAAGHIDRYEPPVPLGGVAPRVAKCAVFVLPSEREAWGNVVVVALSLGRPVIVTESSAISSLVREYGAGIVVPDGDARALASAVESVMTNQQRYGELAQGALALTSAVLSDEYQLRRLTDLYSRAGHQRSERRR